MPVLLNAWHTLNLEEYDIRAHLSLPLHWQWAWLWFASVPNLSWHFAHSLAFKKNTKHCHCLPWLPIATPFLLHMLQPPPHTHTLRPKSKMRLVKKRFMCHLLEWEILLLATSQFPPLKCKTVEKIKLLAVNAELPPTGYNVSHLNYVLHRERERWKIPTLHSSCAHYPYSLQLVTSWEILELK